MIVSITSILLLVSAETSVAFSTPHRHSPLFNPALPTRQQVAISRMSRLRGGAVTPLICDGACATVGLVGASLWLKVWTSLASADMIDPKLSRKIVHSGSAPLFLLTWPFFSKNNAATPFIATLVPLFFMGKLIGASRGYTSQASLVKAVSRTGEKSEALGGPFVYTSVLLLLTLLGFRSEIAVVAALQMAVGDGFADIFGRRWGVTKWPWSKSKSLVGTSAFFLGAFTACMGVVKWFDLFGCSLGTLSTLPVSGLAARLFLISVASAATELVAFGDDNLTVKKTCVVFSNFLVVYLFANLAVGTIAAQFYLCVLALI